MLDGLFTGLPLAIITIVVLWPKFQEAFDRASRGEQVNSTQYTVPVWVGLVGFAWGMIYFSGQWALWGRTLGMRVTGLTLVSAADGSPPSWIQALKRGTFYWGPSLLQPVPFLSSAAGLLAFVGILLGVSDPRKQGWHDKFAQTFVIQSWP